MIICQYKVPNGVKISFIYAKKALIIQKYAQKMQGFYSYEYQ